MGAASYLLPNRRTGASGRMVAAAAWVAAVLLAWVLSPYATLPGPREVLAALRSLWWEKGLGPELLGTLKLIGHALALSVVASLLLAYGAAVAGLRPAVEMICKMRFVGTAGLVLPLMLATGGGYPLKVGLLVWGMSTFLVTAVARIVATVPPERLDHLRVLGAGELRIFWEGVVLATLDDVLDAVRQNVAMGWSMITMVEGISRAEGGIGAMLLSQEKHFQLAEIYAVLLVVLGVGLGLDALMELATDLLCPYARLDRSRSG